MISLSVINLMLIPVSTYFAVRSETMTGQLLNLGAVLINMVAVGIHLLA